jgi:hypothetical protein
MGGGLLCPRWRVIVLLRTDAACSDENRDVEGFTPKNSTQDNRVFNDL